MGNATERNFHLYIVRGSAVSPQPFYVDVAAPKQLRAGRVLFPQYSRKQMPGAQAVCMSERRLLRS